MGLYSSFYSSLSGLATNASALSVIGNNLANLNTDGFKSSSSDFQDLFEAAIANQGSQGNGDPMQVGLGASLASVATDFSQGSFQQTGSVTDMAIQGNGFFTVQTGGGSDLYTRNGNFTINKAGFLVDSTGNSVMGWNATSGVINPGGLPTPIKLNMAGTSGGVATQNVQVDANLDSTSTNPFTATATVFDSLGASHSLSMTYTPSATTGTWNMGAGSVVASDGGTVDATTIPASISFNSNGSLIGWTSQDGTTFYPVDTTNPPKVGDTDIPATVTTINPTYKNPQYTISGYTNGASTMSTTWDLATTSTTTAPTPNFTNYASASTTSATTQDGFGAGTVNSLTVDQNGVIIGNYSNGQTISMAQVAISSFLDQNGLNKVGGNDWAATVASGSASIGAGNTGGRGGVLGSNLELSNVDVATMLTQMIVNQNGYQANSKVVTTTDTLLQAVLNLVQ